MSDNDNVSKLQQLYAAYGRGEINAILDNVTDDCDWGTDSVIAGEVPWYQNRRGRDGVGNFFTVLAQEVEFTKFQPTVFAGAGDQVFVHVDYDYKFRKNGKAATTGAVHQYTMRGGKIAQFRSYEDTAAVREGWGA